MWSEGRSRSKGTGDDDIIATQQQQHVWWRNTYSEHLIHVRHLAHVPVANGLVEVIGFLHRSEGKAAMWSEGRSRSKGTGDEDNSNARAATRGMEEHVP